MSIGPGGGAASELDAVRREYESSLSWRVTRPLRALGRGARTLRPASPAEPRLEPTPGRYDAWLDDERLARIDAACAEGGPEQFALFREVETDLWALLLTQEYTLHPHIRALLPDVPDPALQELWNGASGARLAAQSAAFYDRLRARAGRPLDGTRVLDFGCGRGRLTRFLARDVAPGNLYGCDPVQGILDLCRDTRVPAVLARSEFVPDRLPFDERVDLAYAFSVFTHLSERAHDRCLTALHAGLEPGGILVVTVRPLEYLRFDAAMHYVADARGDEPRYMFAPHAADPAHPQYDGGEMIYGEAVITPAYIRARWSDRFELLHTDVLIGDLFQVMLTLRAV
jgi:SAM-dependent methyltransferase